MNTRQLSSGEIFSYTNQQVHLLDQGLHNGTFTVEDIGALIPASIMIQELDNFSPVGVTYMNEWGCRNLSCSREDINEMGADYYTHFFKEEELNKIVPDLERYFRINDPSAQYSFFQQVKGLEAEEFNWFYTVCKLVRPKGGISTKQHLFMISCAVNGMGHLISKVTKTLDQQEYISKNYKKFAVLTKREKEIITLVAEGKSSVEIAALFHVSKYTIDTHRKNITNKLDLSSFAELIKFAIAFELDGR